MSYHNPRQTVLAYYRRRIRWLVQDIRARRAL